MKQRPMKLALRKEVETVCDELRSAGANEVQIKKLLVDAEDLPKIWKVLNRETVPQRLKRRAALAKKISNLAADIKKDREWNLAQVDGHDSFFWVGLAKLGGRPMLYEWLQSLSESVKLKGSVIQPFARKRDLNTFVMLAVFDILEERFPRCHKRNQQAEKIASYVLNYDIHPGTLAQAKKYAK